MINKILELGLVAKVCDHSPLETHTGGLTSLRPAWATQRDETKEQWMNEMWRPKIIQNKTTKGKMQEKQKRKGREVKPGLVPVSWMFVVGRYLGHSYLYNSFSISPMALFFLLEMCVSCHVHFPQWTLIYLVFSQHWGILPLYQYLSCYVMEFLCHLLNKLLNQITSYPFIFKIC